MKTLKHGTEFYKNAKVFIAACPNCSCIFEFTAADCTTMGITTNLMVSCPECRRKIAIHELHSKIITD